jgi:hypothetical protein
MLLSGPVMRRDILIMIAVLIVAWFVKVGAALLPLVERVAAWIVWQLMDTYVDTSAITSIL